MQSNVRIHLGWIIVILVAVIIALVTVKWSSVPDLLSYLNFALGVTSLVLALVAIIYAIVSNSSMTVTVSKIESGASAVEHETKRLESAVSGLKVQLEAIPSALRAVEGKVDQTHMLISQSAQQREKSTEEPRTSESNDQFTKAVIDHFFRVCSWNGVKIVLLCKLACEKKTDFDLKAWAETDKVTSFDYAYGFLVAASSANFFGHVANGSIVRITSMPKLVSDRLEEEVTRRIAEAPLPHDRDFQEQIDRLTGR